MTTFTYLPSYSGSSSDSAPRVKTAQFGDGYSQRVGDGINTLARVWSLSFDRSIADMDAIEEFFNARKGVESFVWVPPWGLTGKWICPSWKRTPLSGLDTSLTTTFKEVFGD